jgi:restriction system protein
MAPMCPMRPTRLNVEQASPEVAANTIICLIHQANYLLDQQFRSLETAFVTEGGIPERKTHARLQERNKQDT